MIKQILQTQREEIEYDHGCKDDYYFEAMVEHYFAIGITKEKGGDQI